MNSFCGDGWFSNKEKEKKETSHNKWRMTVSAQEGNEMTKTQKDELRFQMNFGGSVNPKWLGIILAAVLLFSNKVPKQVIQFLINVLK